MKVKISKNKIREISKESGIERISNEALEIIQDYVTEYIVSILSKSNSFAEHAGRVTVKRKDTELVLSEL